MKKITKSIAVLLLFFPFASMAQSGANIYDRINVSGFNHDVIADGNVNAESSTTTAFDASSGSGAVFYAKGFMNNFSFGLPTNGLINSESNNGFTYQLQPYNNNNVLKLQNSEIDTLYLETPKAFESISVLAATGRGQSSLNVRFVFEDGTVSNSYNTNVADWFGGQNYAIKGLDRVQRVENIVEQHSNDPRLYDRIFVLNGTDSQKKITKVVFEKTDMNASFLGVFALCGVNNYSAPLPVDFISFELTKLGEKCDSQLENHSRKRLQKL